MRSYRYLGLLQLLIVALMVASIITMVSSCASNPMSTAKTVDQRAYVLYGTFVIFEEQAADVVRQSATPPAVRSAIRKADEVAKPAADSLLAAVQEYLKIKSEISQGATTEDQLQIATANLERWVAESTPLIENLVRAVGGK